MAVDLERLEGWKQIAAFLNKDLRTVQRWERLEGLPVHRHVHRSQASVFAYPHELEAWVQQRVARPAKRPGETGPSVAEGSAGSTSSADESSTLPTTTSTPPAAAETGTAPRIDSASAALDPARDAGDELGGQFGERSGEQVGGGERSEHGPAERSAPGLNAESPVPAFGQSWAEAATAGRVPAPAASASRELPAGAPPSQVAITDPDVRSKPAGWFERSFARMAMAAALVVCCAAGLWLWRGRAPFSRFHQGDIALIGQFDNKTGNRVLDGTLGYLLAGELTRAGWVNLMARAEVLELERRLGLPEGADLSFDSARKMAEREPKIGVLISGEAHLGEGGYVLQVELMDLKSKARRESPRVTVSDEGQIADGLRSLSEWVRHSLGDTRELRASNREEEKVTTSSPVAQRLYTRAMGMRMIGTSEELAVQERLLREAVHEDPNFAAAWHQLGWALKRQGKAKESWMPLLETAHGLASKASLQERLLIDADYAMMQRNYAEAIAARRAYLQLYPESTDALRKLILTYEWTGRYEEALSLALTYVTRQPESRLANYVAGLGLSNWAGDLKKAREFADKASALGAVDVSSPYPGYTWADCFPLFQLWAEGRLPELKAELDRAKSADMRETGARRDNRLRFLGMFALSLGRYGDAESIFRQLSPPRQPAAQLMMAYLQGRPVPVFRGVHVFPDDAVSAILLARSGQLGEARAARAAMANFQASDGDLLVVDGGIQAAEGNATGAVETLRESLRRLRLSGSPLFYLGSEQLAEILEQQGDLRGAEEVLQKAVEGRARAYNEIGPAGAFWMRDGRLLRDLLRRTGRAGEAAQLDAKLGLEMRVSEEAEPVVATR